MRVLAGWEEVGKGDAHDVGGVDAVEDRVGREFPDLFPWIRICRDMIESVDVDDGIATAISTSNSYKDLTLASRMVSVESANVEVGRHFERLWQGFA